MSFPPHHHHQPSSSSPSAHNPPPAASKPPPAYAYPGGGRYPAPSSSSSSYSYDAGDRTPYGHLSPGASSVDSPAPPTPPAFLAPPVYGHQQPQHYLAHGTGSMSNVNPAGGGGYGGHQHYGYSQSPQQAPYGHGGQPGPSSAYAPGSSAGAPHASNPAIRDPYGDAYQSGPQDNLWAPPGFTPQDLVVHVSPRASPPSSPSGTLVADRTPAACRPLRRTRKTLTLASACYLSFPATSQGPSVPFGFKAPLPLPLPAPFSPNQSRQILQPYHATPTSPAPPVYPIYEGPPIIAEVDMPSEEDWEVWQTTDAKAGIIDSLMDAGDIPACVPAAARRLASCSLTLPLSASYSPSPVDRCRFASAATTTRSSARGPARRAMARARTASSRTARCVGRPRLLCAPVESLTHLLPLLPASSARLSRRATRRRRKSRPS